MVKSKLQKKDTGRQLLYKLQEWKGFHDVSSLDSFNVKSCWQVGKSLSNLKKSTEATHAIFPLSLFHSFSLCFFLSL